MDSDGQDAEVWGKLHRALSDPVALIAEGATSVYQKEILVNQEKGLVDPATIWNLTRPRKFYELLLAEYCDKPEMSWIFTVPRAEAEETIKKARDSAIEDYKKTKRE